MIAAAKIMHVFTVGKIKLPDLMFVVYDICIRKCIIHCMFS